MRDIFEFKAVSFLPHPIISSYSGLSSKPPFAQLGTSDRNFSLISCCLKPSGTQMSTFRQDSNLPKWIAFFSLQDTPPKEKKVKILEISYTSIFAPENQIFFNVSLSTVLSLFLQEMISPQRGFLKEGQLMLGDGFLPITRSCIENTHVRSSERKILRLMQENNPHYSLASFDSLTSELWNWFSTQGC